MCAVKVARTDVNDTTPEGRPVVGGHVNSLRMKGKCRVGQGDAAFWTPRGKTSAIVLLCPKEAAGLTHPWGMSQIKLTRRAIFGGQSS
ncbi:hypothetical protein MSTO_49420 [Mycobacterium stomatepiae]|uniref:Uncharacterized protein n=1 Tax=Mycobacterium stomatepiae TaxID=470076 RepID=A0A7I7QF93_9MYCO|nr:hypothetical protein MSTO_49420 [Mycobacterium stomatepiae]